jgi:hypothetical protein
MLDYLLYALIGVFLIVYLLRSILMVGYNHFKFKSKRMQADVMMNDLFKTIIGFKPLFQRRLKPKGYDYKVQLRFQRKFGLYYLVIWGCLFSILFIAAKIYLEAF